MQVIAFTGDHGLLAQNLEHLWLVRGTCSPLGLRDSASPKLPFSKHTPSIPVETGPSNRILAY